MDAAAHSPQGSSRVADGLARLRRAARDGSLADLCTHHEVDLLTLHGSAARGEPAPRDIDLAVLFASGTSRPRLLDLVTALIDLTGTDEIDVMDVRRASPTARARALAHDAIVLHEARPGLATRHQMAALTLEMELRPLRRRQLELLAEEA